MALEQVTSGVTVENKTTSEEIITRQIDVLEEKVKVLTDGDIVVDLQLASGAMIQVTKPSQYRPVRLIGNLENIDKAEKLIKAVIALADAGGAALLQNEDSDTDIDNTEHGDDQKQEPGQSHKRPRLSVPPSSVLNLPPRFTLSPPPTSLALIGPPPTPTPTQCSIPPPAYNQPTPTPCSIPPPAYNQPVGYAESQTHGPPSGYAGCVCAGCTGCVCAGCPMHGPSGGVPTGYAARHYGAPGGYIGSQTHWAPGGYAGSQTYELPGGYIGSQTHGAPGVPVGYAGSQTYGAPGEYAGSQTYVAPGYAGSQTYVAPGAYAGSHTYVAPGGYA